MSSEITAKSFFLSSAGGFIEAVSPVGEVLLSVAIPPGRIAARDYLPLCPDGASWFLSSGVAVLQPRHRIGIQRYGAGSHDSGANPDFRPTSASRFEKEMRLAVSRMNAATDRLERRERALSLIERIPPAPPSPPASDEAPVVE